MTVRGVCGRMYKEAEGTYQKTALHASHTMGRKSVSGSSTLSLMVIQVYMDMLFTSLHVKAIMQ